MAENSEICDYLVVGSGMGGLSAAALLAKAGYRVLAIEKGTSPGGCASSYKKAGYVFEAGATTVVGLDPGLPLDRLSKSLGITFPVRRLSLPMQIHGLLSQSDRISRYPDRKHWIQECIRVWGSPLRQKAFWNLSFFASDQLWSISRRLVNFPPYRFGDWIRCVFQARPWDAITLSLSLVSLQFVLRILGLSRNQSFCRFLREQLLITTQSTPDSTPFLAASAGITYPHLTNYYVEGGIIGLPKTLISYLENQKGSISFKESVLAIRKVEDGGFEVQTSKRTLYARNVISNIPLWNLAEVYQGKDKEVLGSEAGQFTKGIWGAFTMGVAIRAEIPEECLHHQIHLEEPLPWGGGDSIFVSLSHSKDLVRSDNGIRILSISTHLQNPESWNRKDTNYLSKKKDIEEKIWDALEKTFPWFEKSKIQFHSSATPVTWETWTGRKNGRVGGLPASYFFNPFRYPAPECKIPGLFRIGDTVYPGQGIPAVVLGGLNLVQRILQKRD